MAAARLLERGVVRRADRIVFVSRANRDEFARYYGPDIAAKFHVVPNGCDPDEFAGMADGETSLDPFVLLHAGTLYAGRAPEPLLRALAAGLREGVITREGFRLRFLGVSAMPNSSLELLCDELGLQGMVEFVPRMPREHSLRAIAGASGLLVLQPGHAVAVPAKLYEYMAARRPIFAIAEGETADLVRGSGAGVVAGSNDPAVILTALREFLAFARSGRLTTPVELFDGRRRAAEIGALVESVASPGGTAGSPVAEREY
jgi:glycosyltransferase involved in cell wall biosynthesis